MGEYIKVTGVDDIPIGGIKAFELKHHRFVICHNDDGFFALADECTHDNAPISTGRLDDNIIVCPRHGAKFDIRTGEVKAPPAIVPLDTYQLKIENNDIYVFID
ncbi:MAG: non-heme iron oxygenase ferredoxin subunit [FCB group bacterium]|nr:non-heme iron oxygenase ferredoxin subunit [FCB group bacterium]